MPTWKSPLSAASLPSRTRSWLVPSASCARTTAAISRATSAGPNVDESACDQRGRGGADRERRAQLLDRVGVAEGEHRGLAAGGRGDLHRELDGALLVRAHREAGVPAVDGLRVLGEHDLAGGVRDPLDADQDVAPCQRSLSLAGSSSGVASTEPTTTG